MLGRHQVLPLCHLLKGLGYLGAILFGKRVQNGLQAMPYSTQGREVMSLAGLVTSFDVDSELGQAGLPIHQEELRVAIEMGLDGMAFEIWQWGR